MVAVAGTKDLKGFSISTHADGTDTALVPVKAEGTATDYSNKSRRMKLSRKEMRAWQRYMNKGRKIKW